MALSLRLEAFVEPAYAASQQPVEISPLLLLDDSLLLFARLVAEKAGAKLLRPLKLCGHVFGATGLLQVAMTDRGISSRLH
jgi:hypothetical protein